MSEIDWEKIRSDAIGEFTLSALPPFIELPALPHAVTKFVQTANKPDATLKDLARIIETDTGLTVELLRHVNSSFMGLRHKASNVLQALTLLGMRQSKNLIITTGMQAAVRSKKSKLINQQCFWNASLQKALFAREIAVLLKTDADTAFAGAMLQDYLLPVVTNDLFREYLEFVDNRHDLSENICDFERQQFGWDHAIAAACLSCRWHLPDDLVCCVLFHHRGLRILTDAQLKRTPAAAVALSALLPDQLRQDYRGLEQLFHLQKKWSAFNLQDLAIRVDELHESFDMGVRNDFPLSRRCQLAFDDPKTYDDGTLQVAV